MEHPDFNENRSTTNLELKKGSQLKGLKGVLSFRIIHKALKSDLLLFESEAKWKTGTL